MIPVLLLATIGIAASPPSTVQEWALGRPQRTVGVVNVWRGESMEHPVKVNYAEPLVTVDKDDHFGHCLAGD